MDNWLTRLNADPIEWLLDSNLWTRYKTLVDVLDYPEDDQMVVKAREGLLKDEQILQLIEHASD